MGSPTQEAFPGLEAMADFVVIAPVDASKPPRSGRRQDRLRGLLCLVGFFSVIFCNGFSILAWKGLLPLATAVLCLEPWLGPAFGATGGLPVLLREGPGVARGGAVGERQRGDDHCVLLRDLRGAHADGGRASVPWEEVIGGLGISGEAHALAHALLGLGLSFGPLGVLITLYTGTALLTNIISNTATCVMMIPVAAHISEKLQDMEDCHLPLPLGNVGGVGLGWATGLRYGSVYRWL
eukprot:Skav213621  [mRNA]  locus=scaffold2986:490383:493010:+ [translate_table: standard]